MAVVTQAYRYALDPNSQTERVLFGHCAAARFAYNHMLALVKAVTDQRAAERSYGIAEVDLTPALNWSAYGLRKLWNQRKDQAAPWWAEYSKEAYANGIANLASALKNWNDSRRGKRAGKTVGFPRFKSKRRAMHSVRFTTGAMRLDGRMHVVLPRIGRIKTHESTRKPARHLEGGTGRILSARCP